MERVERTPRERLKDGRKFFFSNNKKRTVIYKGDKRVLGNRICSMCMGRLSKVMSNGKGVCTVDHYALDMGLYTVLMCKDSRICNKNLEKQKEVN